MTHSYNDHSGAGHYLQTGHRWHLPVGGGFSATPQDWPSMGSVVEHLSQKMPGGMERDLASYAVLPNRLGKLQDRGQYIRPGEYAGWLGQAYNPMTTVIDKKNVKDNPYWRACADGELSYEIEGLKPVIPVSRIQERVGLLGQFEAVRTRLDMGDGDAMDLHRKRAMALISSDKTSSALNIRAEAETMRDRYGRHLFGQSCLMARRLAERGVRFVQLMHAGWDQHRNLNTQLKIQCTDVDAPSAALIKDLKQRGLLEDTLVIWGGEFGRTPFLQGDIANTKQWGRDHHPYAFTIWMAGGGIKPGVTHGESDEFGFNAVKDKVHIHDLQATIMHLMGIDHERFTFRFQGRQFRLTDIHGEVVKPVLA